MRNWRTKKPKQQQQQKEEYEHLKTWDFIWIWMLIIRKSKLHNYKIKIFLKVWWVGKEKQKGSVNPVHEMVGYIAASPPKISIPLNSGSEVVVPCTCYVHACPGWSSSIQSCSGFLKLSDYQKREELCAISKACLRVQHFPTERTELSSDF